MPEPSPKAFQPYRKVQATTERELRIMLELAARAIQKRIASLPVGIGGQVRAAQLRATLSAIKKLHRSMWSAGVGPAVERAMKDSVDAAESAIEAMTRVAYAALPDAAAEALVRSLRASAESGLKSDAARKRRDLSTRVFNNRALFDGKIEDLIRQGLISNLSAKELADSVYKYVSPTAKGGPSYAAMRLARTEINNAFHERQVQGAQRPGVKAVQWNLSGSHVVPDECNLYAAHKPYAPDQVPDKPHPNCFCYLTYVTMTPADFQKALADGKFDDELERRTRENLKLLGQEVNDVKKDKDIPLTGDDAHKVVPKSYPRNNLTDDQFKAIRTYETSEFMAINGFLRRGGTVRPGFGGDRRMAELVSAIDSAMNESELPQPIRVVRGMYASRQLFGDNLDNDLTGFSWKEEGYGSTTTSNDVAHTYLALDQDDPFYKGQSVKVILDVPAGVKAVEISTSTEGSAANGPQAELCLERGLQWEIVEDLGMQPEGYRLLRGRVFHGNA
jgi:hypothetical protein